MTYAEVDMVANMVANFLVSKGIQPGDKVALSCPNLPYFSLIYWGILKAGATVVPLNVLLKGREVAYHLGDSDAKAYFCFEGTAELPIGAEGYAGFQDADGCELFVVITADLDGESPFEGEPDASARCSAAWTARSTPCRPTRTTPRSSSTPPAPPGSPRARSCGTATCATTRCSARRCSAAIPRTRTRYLCVLPLFHSFGQTVIQNGAASHRLHRGDAAEVRGRPRPAS